MSSADTHPISPARFAAALKDLSVGMLHLKVLEIRNSIAHLQYSNDQLRPFAEGSAVPLSSEPSPTPPPPSSSGTTQEPDQDCIDAIRENEQVIERMAERIAIVRAEVEERGLSWTEFQSKDDLAVAAASTAGETDAAETITTTAAAAATGPTNGAGRANGDGADRSPWTDGTFQTGTISSDGQVRFDSQPAQPSVAGGSLNDEQLRAAMEERMRNLGTDDDDNDDGQGGMHL